MLLTILARVCSTVVRSAGKLVMMGVAGVLASVCVVAGLAAAPQVVWQPYQDPAKGFTVSYPQGWHIRRDSGITYFYQDDPVEGTSLAVIPTMTLKGEMDSNQVLLNLVVAPNKQRYPDFKVVGGRHEAVQNDQQSSLVEAAFTWTNTHKAPMKGWAKIGAKKLIGKGQTVIVYEGYQAPASVFDSVEVPIFGPMLKSLRFGTGR
jgi:hypothetical protein